MTNAILRPFRSARDFWRWLDTDKGKVVSFFINAAILYLFCMIVIAVKVWGSEVYGYTNLATCSNDVESGELSGYQEIYSDDIAEWSLIADDKYDYYRTSADSPCYTVSEETRMATQIQTYLGAGSGAAVVIPPIYVAGGAVANALGIATKIAHAVTSVWQKTPVFGDDTV